MSKLKQLYSKEETVPDEGETSTAVSVYEPNSVSSAKRRKSADYQKSREYRGSNLSSGSRRAIESKGNTKSADNVIDAKYTEVDETDYSRIIKDSTGSRKLKDLFYDEPPVQEAEVPVMKSPSKRPSASKTASKTASKSSKKRVVDAKAPEPDVSLDEQKRIWSKYGRVEDETYKKVKDVREAAEYSLGLRRAKTRGQQQGIDLENVEELAYQAEANRRETEKLKKDVRKAQEKGMNRATPLPEKVAQQGKAVGKAIGQGFKAVDQATATFDNSRIGKNIAKTNEATLRGMQAAGEKAEGSIGAGRRNITPSALSKPRTFGSSSTNQDLKITTRIVRRGRNDVVCYFDQYGRQISAAAARAYLAGKIPVQKPVATVNQQNTAPFILGRPQTLLADLRNHGIPFALGSRQASLVGGTYEAPFAPGHYTAPFAVGTENYSAPFAPGNHNAPFAVNSKLTLVVGGYTGNPIGDMRRSGNPLGNMIRVGNPLGNMIRVGNPLGNMIRVENPLGDDERRGHTSRILRGQFKKEGSPLGDSEKAGHPSGMMRANRKSKKPVTKSVLKKKI